MINPINRYKYYRGARRRVKDTLSEDNDNFW